MDGHVLLMSAEIRRGSVEMPSPAGHHGPVELPSTAPSQPLRPPPWHSLPNLQRAASGPHGYAEYASPTPAPLEIHGHAAAMATAHPAGSYTARGAGAHAATGEERTVRGRGQALRHLQSAGGASSGRASATGVAPGPGAGAAGSTAGMYPYRASIIRAGSYPVMPGVCCRHESFCSHARRCSTCPLPHDASTLLQASIAYSSQASVLVACTGKRLC